MNAITEHPLWLLRRVAGLGDASPEELRALLEGAREETVPAGAPVVAEGELGRTLHVIAAGVAELTSEASGRRLFLGLLETGDVIGELALISEDHRRTATVTALTEVRVLSLDGDGVERFLDARPVSRTTMQARAEELRTADFIRQVAALGMLGREQRRELASHVVRREVARSEVIVRQGDPGGSCFMLRSGTAEVAVDKRPVGVLKPGALFGEGAVVTGGHRTATVRALVACEVLELAQEDFVAVLESDADVAREITYLFRLRQRPRRARGVEVDEHVNEVGERLTTLCNPATQTYFRLSARGRFLWERLDGRRSLRELTLDYFEAYAAFDPYAVADIVAGLGRAQMLDDSRFAAPYAERSRAARARGALFWRREIDDADGLATTVHRRGAHRLFTRAGTAVAALLTAVAIAAFAAGLVTGLGFDGQPLAYLLFAIPGIWLSLLVHEAGHALAVKGHGRRIPAAAVGWHRLSPFAHVDTSEMWLAERPAQIAAGLAGVVATLVVAAPVAVAALLLDGSAASAILWALALPFFGSALVTLCPLLEYDGYRVLSDVTGRPNLRSEALGSVSGGPHRLELLYLAGSLLYLIAAAALAALVVVAVLG